MANETWKFVQAGDEAGKLTWDQRREGTHEGDAAAGGGAGG